MTIKELLTAIAPCPVPEDFIESVGAEISADTQQDISETSPKVLNRAKARLYLYLALVPNVSEGGVSITFTQTEKDAFLKLAKRYANLAGESDLVSGTTYGYKGENL